MKAAPPKASAKKAGKVSGGELHPEPEEEPLPGQMEVMDYPEAIPDAHFEEITDAAPAGEAFLPEEAGLEEMPQGEAPEMAAGITTSPETVESDEGSTVPDCTESPEDIRMDADRYLENLRKTFAIWNKSIPLEFLERAHQDAVSLAAAIEKLMDLCSTVRKLTDAVRNAPERSGRF